MELVGICNITAGSSLTLIFATSSTRSHFMTDAHYYVIVRLSKIVYGMDCIKFDNYFAFKGRAFRHHPPSHIKAYRNSYFVNYY